VNVPRLIAASLVMLGALAPLAEAQTPTNPPRPSFREGKADFHDKELALTYAFGPGALDFALLDFMSLGVAVDQVFGAQSWYYRTTWKLVDNAENGVGIAFNAGATQIREQLAGNTFLAPTWGYQSGLLVSLATESGLIFRGGFQLYDTNWSAPGGQQVLITPEIAYRYSLIEITLQPSFPFSFSDWSWVGLRLRI
jgi:hypothetical protein